MGKKQVSYWVYILHCSDSTFYTGITTDVDRRVIAHNSGKGAKYTRSRLPVEIIYKEECADRPTALRRELEIKAMSRRKKTILIEESNKL